ncbi:MAG TPA: SdrD B-like domain-containing protein, partial [Tepidisphaeraceae bacterium]|nr:SdrD B-like domain-containing protein [Tepidisphaeraceae bacterium]
LGTVSTRIENGLNIHLTLNDDYFRFVPAAAGQFTAGISFSTGQGDLDMALFDSAQTQLTVSEGSADFETISYPLSAGQTYYLKVYGFEGATNPDYGLTIITAIAPDRFEPNDSFIANTFLGNVSPRIENNLTIHAPGNDDYYRFSSPASGPYTAQISFNNALGDLDLILYNSTFVEIARADGDGDVEAITFPSVADQTYYLRVQGYASATSPLYLLSLDQAPGTIAGQTFEDRNSNGAKDAGEATLPGRTVYLDTDNDGQLDPGETSLQSDAAGNYKFLNVHPGPYTLRQIAPATWLPTAPASGSYTVNLSSGQNATGFHFGAFPTVFEDLADADDTYYLRLAPTPPKLQIWVNRPTDQSPNYSITAALLPSLVFKAAGGNDLLTVDFANGNPIPPGGLSYEGGSQNGAPGDSLTINGAPGLSAAYLPSGAAPGSGTFTIGSSNLSFTGLEPILSSAFDSLTLITPKANDIIDIDSPAPSQNRITGASGGTAFESLTFFDIPTMIIDTAANDGPSGSDAIHIGGAGLIASGLNVLSLNVGVGSNFVALDGGTAQLDTNLGIGGGNLSVTVYNTAILNFTSSQRLAALNLNETAQVNLAAPASQVLKTNALNLGPDATLNLASNSVIIQSTPAAKAATLSSVRAFLRSGRNKGAWTGPGITSTTAAADSTHITGLAAIINDRGDGAPIRTELAGIPVDANTILIKYTYNGDGDLSGSLDADDYARIDLGFATHPNPADYSTGDFDYSDTTNSDDYFLIDKAFSSQASVLSQVAASSAADSVALDAVRIRTSTDHRPRRRHHHHVRQNNPRVRPMSDLERARLLFSRAL